jgi:hypothetical protein
VVYCVDTKYKVIAASILKEIRKEVERGKELTGWQTRCEEVSLILSFPICKMGRGWRQEKS